MTATARLDLRLSVKDRQRIDRAAALAGFDEAFTAGGRALLGLRLSPAVATVTLVVGWLLARSPADR